MKRKYTGAEEVAVGDVVQAFEEDSFDTAIVTKIEPLSSGDDSLVHLARPMVRVDGQGAVWMHYEAYSVYMTKLVSFFDVLLAGASGNKDNRGEA